MGTSNVKSSQEARFIWIDCEMTGLNIFEDELCEVGIVPTDGELTVLDEGFDLLIRPSQHAEDQMNDVVRAMHTRSGLIKQWHTSGLDLESAQKQVVSYVERFLPKEGKALLAGNSVGSDKKFLDRYMPHLMERLHYRVIDVSTFKELARLWYPTVFANRPQKKEGHRALADIIESIDELRYYRASMLAQHDCSLEEAQAMAKLIETTSLASQ